MIKNFIKRNIHTGLNSLGIKTLRSLSLYNPLLPFYHTVNNSSLPHINYLYSVKNINNFEQDLIFFQKYYRSIPLELMISNSRTNKALPKNSFHLTFDDGLKEIYTIVTPMLIDRKIDATFFINTDFLDNKKLFYRHKASLLINHLKKRNKEIAKVENILRDYKAFHQSVEKSILCLKYNNDSIFNDIADIIDFSFNRFLKEEKPYLTTKQVKALIDSGYTIGSHSQSHIPFQELSLEKQIDQIADSFKILVEKFSINYKAFAIPFNDLGIKNLFFDQLYNVLDIDIYFGTRGMQKDFLKRNFHRFHLENKFVNENPEDVIKKQYSSTIFDRLRFRNTVIRN